MALQVCLVDPTYIVRKKRLAFRLKYQSFERNVKCFSQDAKGNLIIRGKEEDFAEEYHWFHARWNKTSNKP